MSIFSAIVSAVPVIAKPYNRRAHRKTLGFAAGGVGFGCLIFTGLVGAFREEKPLHFFFVLVVLVVASLGFFERISSKFLGGHEEESEKGRNRTTLLLASVGIAVLIVILHRSLEEALKNDAEAIGQLLASGFIASRVTAAWLRGVRQYPSHAARKGAKSGALVGGIFGFLVFVLVFAGGEIPGLNLAPPPGQELIYRIVAGVMLALWVPLLWGGFGYVGGLAIDKRWGSTPTRGILCALALMAFPVAFLNFGYSYFALQEWNPEPLRMIFMAVGWGCGLILHGDVCDVILDVPAPEPDPGAIPRPRPARPRPVWEVLFVAGMAITVLLLWHQSSSVRFFESGDAVVPRGLRKYRTQFAGGDTRFVNFELDIPKRLVPSGEFAIDEIWKGPSGSLSSTVEAKGEDPPIDRAGWSNPGGWRPGEYTLELRQAQSGQPPHNGPLLARGKFEIVNAVGKLPQQPPSQQLANSAAMDLISRDPIQPPILPPPPAPTPQPRPYIPPQNYKPYGPPQPLPMETVMERARTALAKGNLISPENDSALYWARRARQISPQDLAAIQIEQMILAQGIAIVKREQKAGNYASALRLLTSLDSVFPNHEDLQRLRVSMWVDQQRYQNGSRSH